MKFRQEKVRPVDPKKISSPDDLCRALGGGGFQGRKLSVVVDVWEAMCHEEGCLKVMTLAGALVPAGMGEIIMQLIEARAVDVIVSTGANITHDFVNAVVDQGHYLGSEHEDDDALRRERTNRIFDVYIPEEHYEAGEDYLLSLLREKKCTDRVFLTSEFTRFLGESVPRRSILSVAAENDVPIFVPAISDSELGISVAIYRNGDDVQVAFDEIGDIARYGELIRDARSCGCIILGGGVPRNWAQQVFPFLDVLTRRQNLAGNFPGFQFGVKITTDRVDFGGLSGCSFAESKSWGKYAPGARFASVVCDSTIALPLSATALLARLDSRARA